MAPFKADCIYDSCNDLFTIVWMAGKSTGKRLFRKEVGIGSSKHDFEFPDDIILASSSSVILANDLILSVLEVNKLLLILLSSLLILVFILSKSDLILPILSLKKFKNLFARS